MTLPEAYRLFEHWQNNPPESELVAILVRVFTTWEPKPPTAEDLQAQGAMSIEDFFGHFKVTGGKVSG